MSVPNKTRTVVLTCSVAAITVTGTYYGAGLKTRQENKREAKAQLEASPAEIAAQLEKSRVGLMATKIGLERKIAQLEARQGKKEKVDDAR